VNRSAAEDCRGDVRPLARNSAVAVVAADPREPAGPAANGQVSPMAGMTLIGSGFFITENHVLTCAHVLRGVDAPFVVHGKERWPAEIVACVPDYQNPGSWPLPDVALLKLSHAPKDWRRSPVWLDLRHAAQVNHDGQFFSCGYDLKGPGGKPSLSDRVYTGAGSREGWRPPNTPDTEIAYTDLQGDSIPPFRSGSMVIDLSTGRVTGIVKASRGKDDGDGGYVVPLAEILEPALGRTELTKILAAHDRHHAQHRVWPEMCARWFTDIQSDRINDRPLREAELLGLVAEVRNTVRSDDLNVLPRVRDITRIAPDASLRNVTLSLAATRTPSATDLHSLLEFLDGLSRRLRGRTSDRWRTDMTAWVEAYAADLGQTTRLNANRQVVRREAGMPPVSTAEPRTSLQVIVDPAFGPSAGYHVTMRRHYGPGRAGADAIPEQFVGAQRLSAYLIEHVPAVVEEAVAMGGSYLLDVVVPEDLMHLPVHNWPGPGGVPVGRMMPVTVRCLERHRDNDDEPRRLLLEANWNTHVEAPVSVDWTLCPDVGKPDRPRRTTGWGMVNPPSDRNPRLRRLLRQAVDSGIPLVVWSSPGCGSPHPSEQALEPCGGPFFGTTTDDMLDDVRLADVPQQVFERRRDADDDGLDAIAVSWDDPGLRADEVLLTDPSHGQRALEQWNDPGVDTLRELSNEFRLGADQRRSIEPYNPKEG
jgi:hypothetical protein